MKTLKTFYFFTFLFLVDVNCKKERSPINITLYDKPLSVIQANIQGKWKLHYGKGGICSSCIFPASDNSFNLYANINTGGIIFKNAFSTTVDTTITWTYYNISAEKTWIMNWHDRGGVPYILGAREIRNDTLILYQPGADGMYFFYSKLN